MLSVFPGWYMLLVGGWREVCTWLGSPTCLYCIVQMTVDLGKKGSNEGGLMEYMLFQLQHQCFSCCKLNLVVYNGNIVVMFHSCIQVFMYICNSKFYFHRYTLDLCWSAPVRVQLQLCVQEHLYVAGWYLVARGGQVLFGPCLQNFPLLEYMYLPVAQVLFPGCAQWSFPGVW